MNINIQFKIIQIIIKIIVFKKFQNTIFSLILGRSQKNNIYVNNLIQLVILSII
jgi:hypothetical protein